MKVLVYDKYKNDRTEDEVIFCDDLQPIYEQADIISFHVPLQADTFHYFNAEFLSKIQKPIILINTSRGTVADVDTLVHGLDSKKIIGVGLDVFEGEPINKMNDNLEEKFMYIASLPNAVITPHIAGYSHEALYKMSKILLEKIVTYV